jgi:two-component system, sensor histidine kinase and response regulator
MKLPVLFHQKSVRIAIAWFLPFAAALLQWLLWPTLAPWPWILFYPAVIAAALIGELAGGVGATLISVLLVFVYFVPTPIPVQPQQDLRNELTPLIFLATGVGFSLFYYRLRHTEERYRTVFASAGEGIVVIGRDGRLVDVNPAYCAIVGRTRDEIVGSPAPEWSSGTAQALKVQRKVTSDYRQRRQDGSFVTVEVTATSLRGGKVVAIVRDREEQRRMEAALRQSETKFARLFEASPVPLIVTRRDNGQMVDVNAALIAQFGYSRAELIGRSTLALGIVAPEMRAGLFDRLREEGQLANVEMQVTCKGGEVRECLGYAETIELPGGPHLLVSLVDITARKRAEQRLRDSEERFRLVVENSPSAIFIWDEQGAIRYVSPTIETTLGLAPAMMVEKAAVLQAAAAALPAGDRTADGLADRMGTTEVYMHAWLQAMEIVRHCGAHPGEKVQVEEQLHNVAGEERTLVLTYQGFKRSQAGTEVVTVAHDITEHVALERLLQQTNAALEQQVADRTVALAASVARLEETLAELRRANAGKDAFMAAVSHELRTPLTAILTMSELLEGQMRGPLTRDQARYVTAIYSSGQRLLAVVNNIMLYTQLMAGVTPIEPGTCNVAELCGQAMNAVQAAAAAKQQIITPTVIPPDLEIVTDAHAVINILRMLLDNAVKFTPPSGKIDVSVARLPADHEGEPARVALVVADTGIGMSPAEMDGIFSAFMQSDLTLARRFEGLGLGLAYVREMTARLGGTVSVASEPGRGSRFTVTLPLRIQK